MSEAGVVIGLDLGTSGVKAAAMDASGRVVKVARRTVTLMTDDAGKAEQSVEEVWEAVREVLGEIMPDPLKRVTPPPEVKAICVSGAMHSVAAMDEAGNVIGHATTWADRRCAGIAERLREQVDVDAMYRRTGCPFSALYHPARLRWWEEWHTRSSAGGVNPSGLPRNFRGFAAIKDVVIHRLTGRWCSDASIASATGLMDIRNWRWDAEALELAGITADQLPEIVAPTQTVGQTSGGVPVIAGASDGALANVGAAGFEPGATAITLGTSGAVRRIINQPRFAPRNRTWCYVVERDLWLHGGAINSGGIAVQHAVELGYGQGEKALKQAHAEAATVPAGCDGLMVLPFITGERGLIWPPQAKWTVIGQTSQHTPAHLVRATMEGVAYCIAAMWDVVGMSDSLKRVTPPLLTGGVVRSAAWRQIVADVLGIALQPIEAADASAVGAAMLGWRAMGVNVPPPDATSPPIRPDTANHAKYVELFPAFQASCQQRNWIVS
ncbi:MAG: gluconokinase [Phycisphaerales bacterium]